jgi:hypothetical protein
MSNTFLRRPSETNSDIVVCHCAQCGSLVGASHTYLSLRVSENLHQCSNQAPNRDESLLTVEPHDLSVHSEIFSPRY